MHNEHRLRPVAGSREGALIRIRDRVRPRAAQTGAITRAATKRERIFHHLPGKAGAFARLSRKGLAHDR